MWTSLIAKDAWIQKVTVQYGARLGVYTTAGATLCAFSVVSAGVPGTANEQTSRGSRLPSPRFRYYPTWLRAARSDATRRVESIRRYRPTAGMARFTTVVPGCSPSYTIFHPIRLENSFSSLDFLAPAIIPVDSALRPRIRFWGVSDL